MYELLCALFTLVGTRWSVQSGHRAEGNGSYQSIIADGAEHYGLKVEGIGLDAKKLVQALEDGNLMVALMSRGHFTRGGTLSCCGASRQRGKS